MPWTVLKAEYRRVTDATAAQAVGTSELVDTFAHVIISVRESTRRSEAVSEPCKYQVGSMRIRHVSVSGCDSQI